MIIDTHTHTPRYKGEIPESERGFNTVWRPDRGVHWPYNWAEYMQAMEPVDKAIVFNIAREVGRGAARAANDATAEFVRAYPDKLIGYLSVHPYDPGCLEEIERGVTDLGLKGIKLGPNYQNFDPLGEEAFSVYARAQELGLPITFHTGTSPIQFADLDYAHPRHFDRVAIAFPDFTTGHILVG